MSDISYREAAEYLGVSSATIQNWTRQGLLPKGEKQGFSRDSLMRFQKKLNRGETGRLTARANKRSASRTFLPGEYLETPLSLKEINLLTEYLQKLNRPPEQILYAYFLNKTQQSNASITEEMNDWHREMGSPECRGLADQLEAIAIPEQRDTAGLIYQLLQNEGRKSEKGSYYTPPRLAEKIIDHHYNQWANFLDPCCGSGIFLLLAAQSSGSPLTVEGWDSDSTAVRIARMNLMLSFPHLSFKPKVYLRDSLLNHTTTSYDLIATNPPWGHHFTRQGLKALAEKYPGIKTGESFSYFLASALDRLSSEGNLTFLLPEALLKVKTHRSMREYLLDKCQIKHLSYLGKPFQNVQTEVIRLDLSHKTETPKAATVLRNNRIYSVDQNDFYQNPHTIFDFNSAPQDRELIKSVYGKPHITLKEKTLWILGVVSGNNRKFISQTPRQGYVPIVAGKDITSYHINDPANYLFFDREVLQQCAAPESYASSPKILYRFITGHPVFAIDRRGLVTLNSVNSFLPGEDFSPEVITAFFNSSLYRYILKKRFNSIKVLRSHLEELPIPHIESDMTVWIESLVRRIEEKGDDSEKLSRELDEMVFNFYKISHSDRKYILENL